jgi:hypothetical protein
MAEAAVVAMAAVDSVVEVVTRRRIQVMLPPARAVAEAEGQIVVALVCGAADLAGVVDLAEVSQEA